MTRGERAASIGWSMAGLVVVGTIGAVPSEIPRVPAVETADVVVGRLAAPPPALLAYGTPAPPTPAPPPVELAPALFTTAAPDERAAVAVRTAMAQIGLPYVWGGDGPEAGDAGFDCSGLTTFAYRAAGIGLPRTAHTQYYAGPHVPAGAPLQPGDLVFYGTPARVHHVGMYIGAGRMVNAPRRGKPVQVAFYRWRGDDYLGATRPAATGVPGAGLLPSAPPPPPPPPGDPQVFAAPPAPLPPTPLPRPGDPAPPEPESAAGALEEADRTGARPLADADAEQPAGPGRQDGPVAEGAAAPDDGVAGEDGAAGQGGVSTSPESTSPESTSPESTSPESTSPESTSPGTTAPGTATAPSTGTAPPSTTTEPPSTGGPAAEGGAAATTPTTTTSAPAPAAEEPLRATEASLPGGTVALRSVERGDPLPAVPSTGGGHWSGAGRTVLTVGAPALLAGGGRVTVAFSDGTTASYTAGEAVTVPTAEAAALLDAAPDGTLVALAPAGADRWTVLAARS